MVQELKIEKKEQKKSIEAEPTKSTIIFTPTSEPASTVPTPTSDPGAYGQSGACSGFDDMDFVHF